MRFRRQTRTTIERKGTTTSRVFVYTVRIVQPYSRTYLVDVDDEKRKREPVFSYDDIPEAAVSDCYDRLLEDKEFVRKMMP